MPRTAITIPRLVSRFMGGSTLFNGSTSKISIPSTTSLGVGDITCWAWVKTNSKSLAEQIILSQTGGGFMFGIDGTNGAFINWVDTDSPKSTFATNTIKIGEWAFLSWTTNMTSGTTYLYKNGVFIASNTATVATPQSKTVQSIGSYENSSRFFSGNIGQVGYMIGSLTNSQHAKLYQTSSCNVTPIASYPLDDQPPTYIESIAGNNGTGTNTVYSPDTPVQQRVVVSDDKASLLSSAVDHYVTIGTGLNSIINAAQAYTVICSLKRTSLGTLQSFFGESLNDKWWFNFLTTNAIRIYHDDLTPKFVQSTVTVTDNNWHRFAATYNGSRLRIYLDGKLVAEQAVTGTLNLNQTLTLLAFSGGNNFLGYGRNYKLYSRELTKTEIIADAFGSATATGIIGEWKLNEGSGTIAYDSSGNGNNGTITGATWSADTPSKAREAVGGNMVYNGDMKYIPVVNVPCTTNNRWVDGTASGSLSTEIIFGFHNGGGGTISTMFDVNNLTPLWNPSFKMSLLAVSSFVDTYQGWQTASMKKIIAPCLPNTSYTLTYYMKTNKVSGDSNHGANVSIISYFGNLSISNTFSPPYIKVSTEWTKYTFTFTTGANDRYLGIAPRNYGHTGVGTLIMDAWVGEISLTKTIPDTRTAV